MELFLVDQEIKRKRKKQNERRKQRENRKQRKNPKQKKGNGRINLHNQKYPPDCHKNTYYFFHRYLFCFQEINTYYE